MACRYSNGRTLAPEEFSGGEAPGQANFVLRKLGFTVLRKGTETGAEVDRPVHTDWTGQEVALIVADYFDMLEAELMGKAFKKSEHRNRRRTMTLRPTCLAERAASAVIAVRNKRRCPSD